MSNCGKQKDHCCYINGEPCPFVAPIRRPPFNWQCTLRTELGTWDAVHKDQRYIERVKDKLTSANIFVDCGDWPDTSIGYCRICGEGDVPKGSDP